MKRSIAVLSLVAALAALAAAPAGADRRATARERKAVAWVMEVPARCVAVRVSTVASGWALMYSRGSRSCSRHNANGYVVLRQRFGQWRDVLQNSGTDRSPCSAVRPVPARVGRDFGICRG